jgi:hypothetical protein
MTIKIAILVVIFGFIVWGFVYYDKKIREDEK